MQAYQDVFQRYEKKYLVTQQQYDQLSRVLAPRMVPDRFARSSIRNIYYDTPDFRLIRRSLDRPPYKEKLRLRTYGTPAADSEVFLEIKKKFDHIVYKRRIGMPYAQAVAYLDGRRAAGHTQIAQEIEWFRAFYRDLRPAMFIYYDRFAIVDREQTVQHERDARHLFFNRHRTVRARAGQHIGARRGDGKRGAVDLIAAVRARGCDRTVGKHNHGCIFFGVGIRGGARDRGQHGRGQ